MIFPDKTCTDNPFVDNIIYYAKYMAMNCTVKDEEEALANETKETLEGGDILIACVEGTSVYEIFRYIPKEILEKYIPITSNLDLYADNPDALKTHLNHYSLYERTDLLNKLSKIAREAYIDHYDIMTNYIEVIGSTWIDDNKSLYDNCVAGTTTYKELYDIIPLYTTKRIIKQYLNNYDSSKIDNFTSTLSEFEEYVDTRTDVQIDTELANISKAMREVFISHYEMMINRKYVNEDYHKWSPYYDLMSAYEDCKNGIATYYDLYLLFPEDELINSLNECFGEGVVNSYNLAGGLENLESYFNNITSTPAEDKLKLNQNMQAKYLSNYNCFLNYAIYNGCINEYLDYFDLVEYMPRETLKMIINTQIDEVTNLEVYESNKIMLNSYLQTIPEPKRIEIKNSINMDMRTWYPEHHIEKNNYYRSLIGLPPLDSDGKPYEDTLVYTWNENTKSFKNFGDHFIKQCPTEFYPINHWKQNLWEFDAYDIGVLNERGILDDYIAACGATVSDPRYRYIRYLADNKLNLYQCRRSLKFQLIGIPAVDDDDARKRFVDHFAVNRDYCIRAVYSDAHKFQSVYYDKFMIIFIIINTIMDMLSDITSMIIDREIFDARCIKWLFESFGVPYYGEIPIKYLRAMLKNLNILLKYKSSTRNMIDICNLFGFSDVRVFGYYLFREVCKNETTGEYIDNTDNDITYNLNDLWVRDINGEIIDYSGIRYTKLLEYRHYDEDKYTKEIKYEEDGIIKTKRIINNDAEVYIKDPKYNDFISLKDTTYFSQIKANTNPAMLKFIKVPVNELITKYKNDPEYIVSYDEIVYNDEGDTWDGGLVHENLYRDLANYEFNAVKSKYISVETITDLSEQAFQVSYFYNMLFDNLYSEDALTLKIPYIHKDHEFKFMDVICYIFALMYFYNGLKDNIMYSPTQILYIKGYNFDEALNEILNDPKAFTQEPNLADRENIFDINTRISEDNYDYRKAFEGYGIKSFNLEADIDELEAWLNEFCGMSLDDFIVDDSCTISSQIITLRQFFSLNNSYYQKDIFQNAIAPLPYNQNIKSAYDIILCKRIFETDMDGYTHSYIIRNGYYIEVFDNIDYTLFIMNYNQYIILSDGTKHAIYTRYRIQSSENYNRIQAQYYYYNSEINDFERLFNNKIYIVDSKDRYVFASDAFYSKDPNTDEYVEITDPKYFVKDKYETNRFRLLFGEYWINENGEWVIDPDQAYVWVEVAGVGRYIPLTEVKSHTNIVIPEDDWWIKHSDGHFIKFSETDFYKTGHGESKDDYKFKDDTVFEYNEEDCYVEVDYTTDETDTDIDGTVRYFKNLSEYYYENNWVVFDGLYIYDADSDTYIPVEELISPYNCYYHEANDPEKYYLVIDNLASYEDYDDPHNVRYILSLKEDNDYNRLVYRNPNYVVYNSDTERYVYNSDSDYVTILLTNATYDETKSMVVVFNKEIIIEEEIEELKKYNPEETDKIWDENDWFYKDPAYVSEDIGMHGENIWYYRKPEASIDPGNEEEEKDPVGSGFYMESTAYIGNTKLEKGNKYYMSFGIETNFNGKVQIYNTADDSVKSIDDRAYEVLKGTKQHVSQVFTANNDATPEIRFLIYNFEKYPIHIGDYIIVSNIRFVKAYSDNFIAQDILSYDKLQELYRTNEAIYKYLANLLVQESDFHMYGIYKKIYDSLMISKYNKEAFKIGEGRYATTYTEFIQTRDSLLYSRLARYMVIDEDVMHKEIGNEIIEITNAIDDCIDTFSFSYLYSYFPAVSVNYIQQYITKLINWFKSWKVHLLGVNSVYKLGDPLENTVKILEDEEYKSKYNFIKHNIYIHDTAKVNPIEGTNPSGIKYSDLYDMDEPTNGCNDKVKIRDRVRVITRTANRIEYKDSETELHLVFNDDEIIAGVNDTNKLRIVSSNAGFKTVDTNELLMSTNENDQQAFAHQVIDEINKLSGDYIEWRELIDE